MDAGICIIYCLRRLARWGGGRFFRGRWCVGKAGDLSERLGAFLRLPDDGAGGGLSRCLGDLKPAGEQAIGGHDRQPEEFTLRFAVLLAEAPQQRNCFVVELDRKPGDAGLLLLGAMPGQLGLLGHYLLHLVTMERYLLHDMETGVETNDETWKPFCYACFFRRQARFCLRFWRLGLV